MRDTGLRTRSGAAAQAAFAGIVMAFAGLAIAACGGSAEAPPATEAAPAADPAAAVTSAVFSELAGSWVGTLEYADYSDDSRVQLQMSAEIEPLPEGDGARIEQAFTEPSGGVVRSEELHRIDAAAGTYSIGDGTFDIASSSGFDGSGTGELVLEGTEYENGEEVAMRQTLRWAEGQLSIVKETRTPLTFRNSVTLRRPE